ncbi:hypothetical protein LNV09_04525 [Paucibacter sp. B2R-40]|uniref:hypothetical protein n=1 Tax=Paucibacter sp. B2R-40 TaxID=2893554 RepID=UPI0021E3FB83|nr:hypothetical protein [Paucibacter sp. B2R-40]MCV2353421.1 hypothetical protein [Paucibacter sp. B2R-40]
MWPTNSREIIQISLEKDCFGCSSGERLVLRRDGLASLTSTGKARHQTEDVSRHGSVSEADFDALVRLTLAQGFLAMQAVYEDPQIRDGAWAVISIEWRGGATRQVFRRESQGPEAFNVIESAMQAARARIDFR